MKYVLILLFLLVFWAFIFWRLRPYIAMARRVLGIMRDVRHVSNSDVPGQTSSTSTGDQKLVRCVTCRTWIPASRAVRLRSQTVAYCSNECLESSVTRIDDRRAAGRKG